MTDEPFLVQKLAPFLEEGDHEFQLDDGSRVGVIGGGPAGSYFSYFLLDMAEMMGIDLEVDVYEPRNFNKAGPGGCNHCGGIISESLVQILATEGINIPPDVVQRGISSYVMHMDVGSVRIETPIQEMRIGAVHRGAGPKGDTSDKWRSFDGFLQSLTIDKGANIINGRVTELDWSSGLPTLNTRGGTPKTYDLLVFATGVNSASQKLIKDLDLEYEPPRVTKTIIREYKLGEEMVEKYLGNSMHVFLLDLPGLEFAAMIPKGDYVTICMLGEDIDKDLFETFLDAPEVKQCMPPDWHRKHFACQCLPRMNVGAAVHPYADRLVFVGDSGVTRLYKDGIGGAYRTAKAAASTAIFHGIAAEDFEKHFLPTCKALDRDNSIGRLIFAFTHQIQHRRFARRAVLSMTADEQAKRGQQRRMSMILWDMFTGSAPYRDIFMRTLNPLYLIKFGWSLASSLVPLGKGLPPNWTPVDQASPSLEGE
jgi:flavin-dependent dehydrogenase